MFLYVDDALCRSQKKEEILRNELSKYSVLKKESIIDPRIYLANKVTKVKLENIHWMSKKKASVETSSYVSEFTALEHCCEYPRQLRYKLRMMGIPCEFPSFDYGDNKSVLANSSVPHSTLKKKSCSISYYFIREGLSNDDWRIAYVKSDNNRPDPPSKPLPGSMKREQLTGMLLNQVCT